MAKLVLDTNCLIQCISRRSPYHELWISFLDGRNNLCVTTEILNEYAEILERKTNSYFSSLALEVILLGLSLADWDSGVIPNGFLVAILVVWIMTVGFRDDIQRYAIEGLMASACVGFIMIIATAIASKVKGKKFGYGPAKLAMCLMLFLGIRGACIAVAVGLVVGLIFVAACKSKKRKIALAPAISIGVIVAFLAKDVIALLVK